MSLRKLCLICTAAFCLLPGAAAWAQDANGNDGDLSARANGGKIVMGLWDDDGGTDLGYLTPQVLGVTLGPSGNTFIASEPGMNTRANPSPGTQLPAGNLWSDAMAFLLPGGATAANLFYWNGSDSTGDGDPVFVPVSAGTTLSLTVVRTGQTTTSITADGTPNPSVGLHWGQKIDGNVLHQHPNASLQKTAGTPAEGIYLLGLKFYMTGNATAIDPSDLVLLPFEATDGNAANNPFQDPAFYDDALSAAISWAANNYSAFQAVPEPSTFLLAGFAGVLGLLLRRRSITT